MRPRQPTLSRAGSRLAARLRLGLDHADDALALQHVVDHGEVARLEDVERHLAARQQQRTAQGEERDRLWAIPGPLVDGVHAHTRSRPFQSLFKRSGYRFA